MPGQRPRIDAGDRRNARLPKQGRKLAGLLDDGCGGIGDDQAAQPRPRRLVVGDQAPVVADQRVRHHDELAGVRGVGADLLVARLARVHEEVAATLDGSSEGDPREDRAVLEGEERWPEIAHAGIHDGTGMWERRDDDADPARAQLAGRGHVQRASFPASLDRYTGLSGPAVKELREG